MHTFLQKFRYQKLKISFFFLIQRSITLSKIIIPETRLNLNCVILWHIHQSNLRWMCSSVVKIMKEKLKSWWNDGWKDGMIRYAPAILWRGMKINNFTVFNLSSYIRGEGKMRVIIFLIYRSQKFDIYKHIERYMYSFYSTQHLLYSKVCLRWTWI